MKVRDVIAALEKDGWREVRQESSHRTFRKKNNPDNVVVNGHDRDDLSPDVLSKIRRQTGLPLR